MNTPRKPTIAIITEAFPFSSLEPYLENEIEHWQSYLDRAHVIIMPRTRLGHARDVPRGIVVDLALAKTPTLTERLRTATALVTSRALHGEIRRLALSQELSVANTVRAVITAYRSMHVSRRLSGWTRVHAVIDVAYCYWNDVAAFGAITSKDRGDIRHVVSRAHGYDLYAERRPRGYMPLKQYFLPRFDRIHPVSNDGVAYLRERYSQERGVTARVLGVSVPNVCNLPNEHQRLHLLSVSSCTSVKRLHLIPEAIAEAALQNPQHQLIWTHIGDGISHAALKAQARQCLDDLPNVEYDLPGQMTNQQVHHHYATEPTDFVINVSSSEGIPVSIMEAMSYGIPALATDVGGVAEVVRPGTGRLIDASSSISAIAGHIIDFGREAKTPEFRSAAAGVIRNHFDSATNYATFIGEICDMASTNVRDTSPATDSRQ